MSIPLKEIACVGLAYTEPYLGPDKPRTYTKIVDGWFITSKSGTTYGTWRGPALTFFQDLKMPECPPHNK